ncbi:hypothetical protein BB559_006252 [Furculomyces boomerangus]|uniref:Mitochondrial import inner membrane translocase subunit n=2 Tax=Harpellales TaxID=61421 RepID=A0A2T9Y3Y2_9FUNG|nr:hypothetical protein BB559_006252 [Furculomyces boomerangus]PVZ97428.1 hypothetical protein BB558_006616 [Smittium angustum]
MFGGYGQQSLQEQQMQAMMEQKQMKDFMKMYSNLVSKCFDDCVSQFDDKTLTERETTCTRNCTQKFMKLNERIGARFAEENQKLMESQGRK